MTIATKTLTDKSLLPSISTCRIWQTRHIEMTTIATKHANMSGVTNSISGCADWILILRSMWFAARTSNHTLKCSAHLGQLLPARRFISICLICTNLKSFEMLIHCRLRSWQTSKSLHPTMAPAPTCPKPACLQNPFCPAESKHMPMFCRCERRQ